MGHLTSKGLGTSGTSITSNLRVEGGIFSQVDGLGRGGSCLGGTSLCATRSSGSKGPPSRSIGFGGSMEGSSF